MAFAMSKGRLEAFSDGVIAIIITIMVLELKVPHGHDLAALRPLAPVFASYVLSFVYVGIYWNNHHHLLHLAKRVTGGMMWANLHLLFWLSLFPFVTGWMGENHGAGVPSAVYGGVLLMAAIAYTILQRTIVAQYPANAPELAPLRQDIKGKISVGVYVFGLVAACVYSWIAHVLYASVALLWLVPDRRIEKNLKLDPHG
jgi:uncharacterized membrane protein